MSERTPVTTGRGAALFFVPTIVDGTAARIIGTGHQAGEKLLKPARKVSTLRQGFNAALRSMVDIGRDGHEERREHLAQYAGDSLNRLVVGGAFAEGPKRQDQGRAEAIVASLEQHRLIRPDMLVGVWAIADRRDQDPGRIYASAKAIGQSLIEHYRLAASASPALHPTANNHYRPDHANGITPPGRTSLLRMAHTLESQAPHAEAPKIPLGIIAMINPEQSWRLLNIPRRHLQESVVSLDYVGGPAADMSWKPVPLSLSQAERRGPAFPSDAA